MKYCLAVFVIFSFLIACETQNGSENDIGFEQKIYSEDLSNFWTAFDSISSTENEESQKVFLQRLFLDKASVGQ